MTQNRTEMLSRSECNVLRGLAIIGIFLHNYCHWLGPIVKENEYQYIQHNVDWLAQVMAHPDIYLPIHLLSFFGHYGVPIFLFLSAYGLVLKYETGPRLDNGSQFFTITGKAMPTWGIGNALRFIRYHYLKLFKMMIMGFVAFTMVDYVTPHPHHYQVLDIIAQLGMFNNVLENPDGIIWPGPFWFFGLMLQLYIVYRLVIYRRHWAYTVVLMVACVAIQMLLDPEGEPMNRYRYNFMGGMLPFGIGILYARYGEKIIMTFHNNVSNLIGVVFCCFIIYSLSQGMVGWTFVPLFICLLSVLVAKVLSGIQWLSGVYKVLEWMGTISAALFVCHPVTRKIFIPISRWGDTYAGLLLYIVSSICLAWLFSLLMKKIPNPKMK